jgi:hypothetical protein
MDIKILIGKTLTKATGKEGDEEVVFEVSDGTIFKLAHFKECCETVIVADICGDMADLVGSPILQAESSSEDKTDPGPDCGALKWTFYRITTQKGQVVIRWVGESNGYYGVDVDFVKAGKSQWDWRYE